MACVTSSLACSQGGWSSGFSVKPIMGKTDAWVVPHRVNPKVSPKREVTLSTSLAKERASITGEITGDPTPRFENLLTPQDTQEIKGDTGP
jgi:hypothetical protein